MREDSRGRRSAQSAMYRIVEAFVRWIAPILSFTADEMWGYLPGEREGNVLFATWYDGLAPLPADAPLSANDFDRLLALREQVAKVLETDARQRRDRRRAGAEIELHAGTADHIRVAPLVDELRFLLISGDVTVLPFEGQDSRIVATPTKKAKCVRCWHHRADVGSVAAHPQICARCVSNVEGPGEDRKWF